MLKKLDAFTLIEVMITLVILGVLAGMALPMYTKTVEESRANEARVNLQTIHYGEKIYKLNNNAFWPVRGATKTTGSNLTEINTTLNIDLAVPQFYDISITTDNTGNYTATATRKGDTRTFTINGQTGVVT